jgi:AbrB family looped-hinge helix DNA binding protein
MFESTITSRGQTTLPKAVREALGLKAGDRIGYTIEGSAVRIRPLRPIARLRGLAQHKGPPLSLEDMDRVIAEDACESRSSSTRTFPSDS